MSARTLIKLVSIFRAFPRSNPGRHEPGGYADSLASHPYGLGAAYLKAYCDSIPEIKRRYDLRLVNIADRSEGPHEEAILPPGAVKEILKRNPATVCFSAYCFNVEAALAACSEVKKKRPSIVTILGGRRLAERPDSVDIVIDGEAELPLANWLAKGEARGGPLKDIDEIPSPYLAGVLKPPSDGMMLELSRGCPNECGYCAWNSAKLRRTHSGQRIESELHWAVAHGVSHIAIVDSAINYETETLRRFVVALKKADPKGRLCFTYNIRYEMLDREQAALLRRVPTAQVLLGMETVSPNAMRAAGRKPFDRKRFEAALALLKDVEPPSVGVILGLPGDTVEGFKQTMRYLESKPVAAVLVSLLQVFPGTPMHKKARRLGLKLMPHGIPYLWTGPGWGRTELREALTFLRDFRRASGLIIKGPEGGHTIASAKSRLLDLILERFPFLSVEKHEAGSYVPAEVLVRATPRCNQRCPFCSAPLPSAEPAASQLKLAVQAAGELFPGAQFTLTGGEPTLRTDLPELVRAALAGKRFSQVRVQTNGVAFADAGHLKKFRPDAALVFFVSLHALDGAVYDELTGTRGMLPKALSGLKALIAAGHRVIVNIVINDRNVGRLEDYAARLAKIIGRSKKVEIYLSALTCREHRPAAASYLVPYGRLVPELLKAMRRFESAGIPVQSPISATHASFPPCVVPPALRKGGGRIYRPGAQETGYEDMSRPFVKARACGTCAFDDRCLGLPREYAARFGLGDCRPIKDI